jgi:hypothetical protein
MIYSEKQLESFGTPPFKYETKQIIKTKDDIQKALDANIPSAQIKEQFDLSSFKYDIYLQGSYKNSTNISKSSDVDIVIELTSVFYPDTQLLNESQRIKYDTSRNRSKYRFANFKTEVQNALVSEFGDRVIKRANKCIKFLEHDNYCNADVIPCFTHKQFTMFESYSNSRVNEGIEFKTDSNETIINYPHQHYNSLTAKSQGTSGKYKETVRMIKTLKEELIANGKINDGVAKSYYIENLLYNLDDDYFKGSHTERFRNILNKVILDYKDNTVANYVCANNFQKLISSDTWSNDLLRQFLVGLTIIRDNNEF